MTTRSKHKDEMMMVCEKCWRDAGGDPHLYAQLLCDRRRIPCEPEQKSRASKREARVEAAFAKWRTSSELARENVYALLKGYPKAVAVLRLAARRPR